MSGLKPLFQSNGCQTAANPVAKAIDSITDGRYHSLQFRKDGIEDGQVQLQGSMLDGMVKPGMRRLPMPRVSTTIADQLHQHLGTGPQVGAMHRIARIGLQVSGAMADRQVGNLVEEERDAFEEAWVSSQPLCTAASSGTEDARSKAPALTSEDGPEVEDHARSVAQQQANEDSASTQHRIDERIRLLELEVARKQAEILLQMRTLKENSERLEAQVGGKGATDSDSPAGVPVALLSASADVPRSTAPEAKFKPVSLLNALSGKRTSVGIRTGERNRFRMSVRGRRQSITGPATVTAEAASNGNSSEAVQSRRKWWAEQRQFLLEDLFPSGSSNASRRSIRSTRPANRRNSSADQVVDAEHKQRFWAQPKRTSELQGEKLKIAAKL
eukprot:TRINITY_DN80944_c0_g1_i1.p1 TRINITY_DN80944_c0_g1~~TRINITY_DN80944_c0_g1_i1.p1  ORF type:complete len:409 (+),score=73.07 TRINITY_DN80944_c0_g1_i1:71-1228(+)